MKQNLGMEIINPDSILNVMSYMPNPNEIFKDRVSFFQTVDEMLTDPKIYSHLRLRKSIVTSFNFVIEKENAPDNVYEFIRDNLTARLNWENDIKEFLSAIEYGFSFSEVLWVNKNGYYLPDALRNKNAADIGFVNRMIMSDGIYKNHWIPTLKRTGQELNQKYKFLIYRNEPRSESPYGTSDLIACYWAWKFKQLGWDFWARASQKASVPSIVALFDIDTTDEKKAQEKARIVSSTLAEMESGAGVAFANVKSVTPLPISGNVEGHKTLIEVCNNEIAFALTTQSLSTQEANYGSRAQAEVHDANLVRVAHGDAKALQGTLQTLIDWMVALNFGENVPSPKGYFDIKNYATFQEVMQAVQNKIPLSKEALYTRYGLPRPEDDNDLFIVENQQPQTPFNFSDSKKKRSMIF